MGIEYANIPEMWEKGRAASQEDRKRQALQQFLAPALKGDQSAFDGLVHAGAGNEALAAQQHYASMQKSQQDALAAKHEQMGKVASAFAATKSPALWAQLHSMATELMPQAEGMPADLDTPEHQQGAVQFATALGQAYGGAKAPEPYTLTPGSKRFGIDNQMVAEVAKESPRKLVEVPDGKGGSVQMEYDGEHFYHPNYEGAPAPTTGGAPGMMQGALGDVVRSTIAPLGGRITAGFDPTKAHHNAGSGHYSPDGAYDVGMGRESPEQQAQIIASLQSHPELRVVDERQRPPGQKVWGGPHVHVERAQGAQQAPSVGALGYKPPAGKESAVTKRQQELVDMQSAGIKISPETRTAYLMTGKMPAEEGGALANDPLAGLSPAQAAIVKKIATYDVLPSSLGRAANRADLLSRATMLNPDFSEATSKEAYAFKKDLGATSPTSAGGQVTAANTLVHHLGTLLRANKALNDAGVNSDYPWVNKASASVSHGTGSAAVNNWKQATQFVSEEMMKLVKGGVASEGEVNQMLARLSATNSPEQRNAAILQIAELAHGRLSALETHRDQALGEEVGAKTPILSKESKGLLDAVSKLKGGNAVRAPAAPKPSEWSVKRVK